jgi:two-component system response regulator BaeR
LCGIDLQLTNLEFKLLQLLATSPGRIFRRDTVMAQIYHDDRIVIDRTIDSHIRKLRKKMMAVNPDEELIHSVYGVGYKFEIEDTQEGKNPDIFVLNQ